MNKRRIISSAFYPILFYIAFIFFILPSAIAQKRSLPFTMSVTPMQIDNLPDYLTSKSPDEWMDFPVSTARIDGAFWVMFKNGETKPAFRYKGTNFEDGKREPDGKMFTNVSRPYILGGMWYDSTDKKLYAPLHCETRGYYTSILRQIHLASSTDMGLTWKYEGPIITRDDPRLPLPTGRESSGLYWDGGEGDFVLYVDTKGGYVYLYTNSYTFPKADPKAPYFSRHHVARCRISDKMAPGKWQKFYNGSWSEPALGGKASDVNGYYVMYNSYLKKYISFNYGNSISICSDLSKQDWTPCYKIKGDYWGNSKSMAWLVTNEDKTDVYSGGKTLFVYSYWEKSFHGLYKIDFDKGQTSDSEGYMVGFAVEPQMSMDTTKLYLFGSRYESPDSIESRHFRKINFLSPEISYSSGWVDEKEKGNYPVTARENGIRNSSLQFSFKAKDIYWRAVKGPGCGKADVYLDDLFQETVDCWANPTTPLQFSFIKTGLDPDKVHTIKIVVRGDKNPNAFDTEIKHLGFEYSAESYRASDGFSNVMGKNNWYYQERNKGIYTNMVFKDPFWVGTGNSEVGYFHMTSGTGDAVKKWIAPKAGRIRIEGNVEIEKDSTEGISAMIKKNNNTTWMKTVEFKKPVSHNFTMEVHNGDAIYFIINAAGKKDSEKVSWDPAITYED